MQKETKSWQKHLNGIKLTKKMRKMPNFTRNTKMKQFLELWDHCINALSLKVRALTDGSIDADRETTLIMIG